MLKKVSLSTLLHTRRYLNNKKITKLKNTKDTFNPEMVFIRSLTRKGQILHIAKQH